jgi:type IX secretion system PorP/SprF family membrane protein
MYKSFLLSFALCFIGIYSLAQAPLVQYMENLSYFNPAALTYQPNDSIRISTFYRNQWVGFEGSPLDISGVAEYNLSKINSGVGLNFSHERIGFNKIFDVGLAYRYSLKFKNDRALSAGVSLNYYHMRIEGMFITPPTSFYVNSTSATLTSRFGLLYSSPSLLLGISVFHPTQPQLRQDATLTHFKLARMFNFHSAYNFRINMANTLRPELIIFADRASFFSLINFKWIRNDKLFVGAGFKNIPGLYTNYALNMTLGYEVFGKLYFGAAYEYVLSTSSWSHPHSFELMIRYAVRKNSQQAK